MSEETKQKSTLEEKIFPAVVVVKFCITKPFDTDKAGPVEGSGFVVDAERGFVLTFRINPALFWGYLQFENHEVVTCRVVISDPEHDFSILEFDVKALKSPVVALTLRPDLAKLGEKVRIVGNDACQKLSVHEGVISRIDRNAPEYPDGYCDFNTTYLQAALGAVRGSAGSPVCNIEAFAVGLQVGGRLGAATDYFLPLDHPLRVLQHLQQGERILRGTIQCQWMLKSYSDCKALGLTPENENAHREAFPKAVTMLVAHRVLPQGPSDSKIKVGDVLVRVHGERMAHFDRLNVIMDSSIGKTLKFQMQRHGEDIEVEVEVEDLYNITPSRYVLASGASFNTLSYQLARRYGKGCKGVYVSDPSGSYRDLEKQSVLETVDGKKVPDLNTLIEVVRQLPDQKRFVVTYRRLETPYTLDRLSLINQSRWSPIEQAVYNPETLEWEVESYPPVVEMPPIRLMASFPPLENVPPAVAGKEKSFVRVLCSVPIFLHGLYSQPRNDPGIVLDAKKGLIYVSQVAVPYSLCNISLTFGDSVTIPGRFVYQHIEHGYTVINYDPSLVDGIESIDISSELSSINSPTYFVGMDDAGKIQFTHTTITDLSPLVLIANSRLPSYRAINTEVFTIESELDWSCPSGLLIDYEGKVRGIQTAYQTKELGSENEYAHSFFPTPTLRPIIEKLQMNEQPNCRVLGVEFQTISIAEARDMKVSEEWISKILKHSKIVHQLLEVKRSFFIVGDGDERKILKEGDVILTFDHEITTRFPELDRSKEVIQALVVRDGEERTLQLCTSLAGDFDIKRALQFCGAVLHAPQYTVRIQVPTPSEVYISAIKKGSPADLYGIRCGQFIIGLNGVETLDLESCFNAARATPCDVLFSLTTKELNGIENNMNMMRNDRDFPTVEWVSGSSGWEKVEHGGEGMAEAI